MCLPNSIFLGLTMSEYLSFFAGDHHPVSLGWTHMKAPKNFGFSIFLVGHDVAIAEISPCTYIYI